MNTDKTPKKKPGRPKITTENNITREQILKTAAHLFMAYGYEKVSMEQVAEASDVTKASVYYYFKNKATLFTVSVSSMFQRITKQTEKLLQNSNGLKHRLYEVTLDHLKRPHIDFETLLQEATSSLTEDHIREIREAEKAIHEALENVFKQAANNGEIVVASPRLLAHTFSTVTMIRNKKELITELGGPEKTAQALVDLFWVGISPN
ncbi:MULTISPECIES: TetR/AcrR family transcriptional regulator [Priestia]|uniref:TetR/AcrR family transcriptional regulator n=1 Tax=Priestia aryabhattai TaxID=412384 RepID=A0ABD5KPT8_PRIAR|nr:MULTISPECIES: TetR/AcrR family transcriptional regulator [Priestia]MBK0290749.1 TetR/AcrR family transcriptional regulator [Bacillus sp. S34]UPK48544.1 TetR/AcrR family transcriptional regulator [Bacillus sp. H8-1]MBY0061278.1 TetR/AcrR family transcriptional regulator [Priestia aryabhattai]MDC7763562.1 TetR/AcrR family transcriptional regulator [Priestia aryabhattai]MDN3361806.1 TetR/AcrR family transcriptional regulator [Priestia megaterium]